MLKQRQGDVMATRPRRGFRGGTVLRCALVALLWSVPVLASEDDGPVPGGQAVNKTQLAEGEYTDCRPTTSPLVFDGGYQVSLCYETAQGVVGEARGGIWASGQSGLLWFFDRDNAEVLVKVLNGCAFNGRRWIFVAPVTDVAFNLHVTSSNGRQWVHRNRLGVTAGTSRNTSAFVCDTDDADRDSGASLRSTSVAEQTVDKNRIEEGEYTDCRPTTTPLVFDGGYQVSLCYETAEGLVGEARGGIWASNQSGLLWFFDRGNAEVLVKVLDGCSSNGHRWIFVAPVTDVAFNLEITSSSSGRRWTHRNRLGVTGTTSSDISVFVCAADDGMETVSITPDTLTFTALDQTAQLFVTARDEAGRVVEGVDVFWSSGDTAVATVDSAGMVSAVGVGTTVVTAQWDEASGEAVVEVLQVAHSVAVSPAAETIGPDVTLQLVAEAYDENGHRMDGAVLAWSSSDASVALVNSLGLVRGVAEGSATIAATIGAARGTSEITVEDPDRPALVALYRATDGPNWLNNDGWLSDAPLGDWYGVYTDQKGRVEGLDLAGKFDDENSQWIRHGLEGAIPPELGSLTRLLSLDLSRNRLSGAIPPELGRLASLESLNLRDNDLTGAVPSELSRLASLVTLDLSLNRLSGAIPPELGRLASLGSLYLGSNDLTGPIPPELGNSAGLSSLNLSFNPLGGTIPPELGNLARLWHLSLRDNQLRGAIPPQLGRLGNLASLFLSGNDLTGPIPPQLGSLGRLEWLDLSFNRLSGLVPLELGSLASLELLYLAGNQLTGLQPGVFVGLTNLTHLNLSRNPGSPFRLTLQLLRLDNESLLAPGPARVALRVAEGAPFAMRIPLSATGGDLSVDTLTLGTGSAQSTDITVTRTASGGAGVQVAASRPPVPRTIQGIEIGVAEPIVLFPATVPTVEFATGFAAAPEGGTAVLRLMLNQPATSAVTFTYSLGIDDDPATADADASDHAHGSRGSVQIAAGANSADVEIVINDDDDLEPAREVLAVTLETPGEGTGYIRGFQYVATVTIKEGVCDRTPQVRDEIVAVTGAADCAGTDDEALGGVRHLRLEGNAQRKRRGPKVVWTEELLARIRSGECEPKSWVAGATAPVGSVACAEEGEPVETVWMENRFETTGDGDTVTTLREGDFSGLPNLEVLYLLRLGLRELPPGVFADLSKLNFLSLQFNELTSLPVGVFLDLRNLSWLILAHNLLTSLPERVFGDVPDVSILILEYNELTEVSPHAFAGLSGVRWLYLNENFLTDLPPGVFSDLSGLTFLNLRGNELSAIAPGAFTGLSGLPVLSLSKNRLTAVPTGAFGELAGLRVLFLSDNRLGALEGSDFLGLPILERLSLSNVGLAELSPGTFSNLQRLEELDLRANELTELPAGVFTGLTRLKGLGLVDNPGAPFPLTLEPRRADTTDLLAPGPAAVAVELEQGAPFNITVPLSVHGGRVSANAVVLGAGRVRSDAVTVIRSNDKQSTTQVVAGPAARLASTFSGIELLVADPLILFGTASNRAPVPERRIPVPLLRVGGESESVGVSSYFRDPDGDELRYAAAADNPDVVSVEASGDRLRLLPVGPGSATITVTATDPDGLSAALPVPVSVRGASPGLYDIDLIFVDEVGEPVQAAFHDAVDYWSSILAGTELPDVPVEGDFELGCWDVTTQQVLSKVEELVIVASVREIDGPRGILAGAGWCGIRDGEGGLPFMGAMLFDVDDLEWLQELGALDGVILHEIGHVLGVGTAWDQFDLLVNPSLAGAESPDTHFPGALAVAAFDKAGGTQYTEGEKVPVENEAGPGSADSHWRESVLDDELLTPFHNIGVSNPLSAVTIQSLADLGYTVDASLAEPYTLPGTVASDTAESVERIEYGDDVLRGPIIVVDPAGRIVRVSPY